MSRRQAEAKGSGGMRLLHGRHPVIEALRAGRRPLETLVLRAGGSAAEQAALRQAAHSAGVPVEEAEPAVFDRMAPAGVKPQGVLLRAGELPDPLLDELLPEAGPCCLVALDGVEDPQNVGAIARVAEAAGAAGLLLTRRRSPPLGAAVSRASAGAIEWLPVARVTNLGHALKYLKEEDFWIYGADSAEAADVFALPRRLRAERRVLVLGAEGRGLREGVRALLDHAVQIPMRGHVASLNVATAGAVLLYALDPERGE